LKAIHYTILLCFILFGFANCNQSKNKDSTIKNNSNLNNNILEEKIIGTWLINKIERQSGVTDSVPIEYQYDFKLENSQKGKLFQVEGIHGNWHFQDSLLFMENTPVSEVYIDSIFVINDLHGNSEVVLKNGSTKIASITNKGVIPEKITSVMKLIFINEEHLKLSMNGDIHIYQKK